jgi:hypothetical protein
MTPEEITEFHALSDKRDSGKMTNAEYKRYLVLVNKFFREGLPKVVSVWGNGFGL